MVVCVCVCAGGEKKMEREEGREGVSERERLLISF
jgi:hypothetical protein